MNDLDTRDLAQFANAAGQPNQPMPSGHAIMRQTTGLAEARVLGAQPVAVYRDEQKVLQKLSNLAAAAGSDWFYRFPVRKKEGGVDYIEGPSIKLANEVMRVVGNIALEVRELDVGDCWVIYARASDLEGGSSMERAYRQRKSQTSMRTKDVDRQLDIAFQVGQSKAIRNVICNFLQIYCDYAFEQAQGSLVEKIGKSLDAWRERTLEGLRKMPVDVTRVERTIGRSAKDWLAPDIARIVAMMRSVADGMASADDVFPLPDTAAAPAASSSTAVGSGEVGGGQGPNTRAGDQSAARNDDLTPSDDPAAADPASIAYRRGHDARKANHKRSAVPGEYRDKTRMKECDAWLAGFDDKPMPQGGMI